MRAKIITARPSFFNLMRCLSLNKACHCSRLDTQYFAWVFLLPENRDDCDGIWFAKSCSNFSYERKKTAYSQSPSLSFTIKLQRHPLSACSLILCVQAFTEWIYSHSYNTVCSYTGKIQILELEARAKIHQALLSQFSLLVEFFTNKVPVKR